MAGEKVLKILTIDGTTMYGHLDDTVSKSANPLPQINPWVDYVPSNLTTTLDEGIYLIRYAFDPTPSTETGVRYLDIELKADNYTISSFQYTDANAGQFADKTFSTFIKLDSPMTITVHIMTSKTIPSGSGAYLDCLKIF